MSQKLSSDGTQKGFAIGRGLLAAAETLNFSMGEKHSDPYGSSSQSRSGMSSLLGGEGKDHDSQLPRRAGSHLSNTMKLFASLGLSPTDLDALAQVPEENISVETLPRLIMELKNRKMEAGRRMGGDLSTRSSETSYRNDREDWGDTQGGRMDRSGGQSQNRSQGDIGYSSTQDTSSRGFDMLDYGSGGSRDRQYSDLSRDSYRGLGMSTSSSSDDMFMQRRAGTPSNGKVQDFLGVMPLMFPHVCALCDFDVHNSMEWTQHTTGIRHSENRRLLLQMYPDWDPHMPSSRMSTSLSLNTKNRSDGLLGAAPVGVGLQRTGMSSNWGSDSGMGMTSKVTSYATAPKIRSRVVVAKYDRKPMSSNTLFALAKPFGAIREHLVLNNKAFLELETHEEALAMANYYHRKPAILHGKEIKIYLSKELLVIEKARRPDKRTRQAMGVGDSKVVFFSNLPRGADQKMELLTISRRFGIVEKHLFLNDEAFVEMSNAEDAEMLVKYYTLHPLTIGKSSVRLNICAKYKTLTVPPGKGQGRVETTRRSSDNTSRTSDKSSSKSQRSSSSKAKESLDKKVEVSKQEDENEAKKEESGDEEADVMEARDGDEEDFVEEPSAEEEIQSCEPEESSTQPDPETNIEHEDPEEQQANDGTDDADAVEDQEETEEKQEEAQMEEPAVSETEQGENADELPKQQPEEENGEQPEDEVPEEDDTQQEAQGEIDFPENLDEFVTLDELAEEEDAERHDSKSRAKNPSGSSKDKGGLRVVNVVGFKRGYGYLDEILSLAKPFGKVVRHLVLDVRPEAFLELSNEQEAKAMSNFYSGNVIPSVCGKPVKVYHSHTYPTIQSGRVVYIGNLPTFKSSDASLLKIAEPFGQVKRYFLNRLRNECFIEMEKGEDAEKMVETYKESPAKFEGKRLAVYISRKYKQLKHGHRPPSPESEDKRPSKRERSDETETQSNSSGKSNTKKEEEPSPKKSKVEKPTTDKHEEVDNKEEKESPNVLPETVPEVIKEDEEEQSKETPEVQKMETEPEPKDKEPVVTPPVAMSEKSLETEEKSAPPEKKPEISLATLGPHDPNVPVGVEFVKMGYYCRVCFLFYSNEDTAKKVHCCSQSHYDKLKKHLEKEKAKAQSNGGKK